MRFQIFHVLLGMEVSFFFHWACQWEPFLLIWIWGLELQQLFFSTMKKVFGATSEPLCGSRGWNRHQEPALLLGFSGLYSPSYFARLNWGSLISNAESPDERNEVIRWKENSTYFTKEETGVVTCNNVTDYSKN